jgi:O-antigen/teichoic acid export membrane protein
LSIKRLSASRKDAIVAFGYKILSIVFSFALTIVLTRILGVADSGVFFTMQAVVVIGAAVCRLGFDKFALREVATTEDRHWLAVMSGFCTTMVFVGGVMLALLLMPVGYVYFEFFEKVGPVFLAAIPFYALFTLLSYFFQGKSNIFLAYIGQGLGFPVLCVFFFAIQVGVSVSPLIASSFSFLFASLFLAAWLALYWRYYLTGRKYRLENIWIKIRSATMPMWGVTVLLVFQQWAPAIILAAIANPAEVSYLTVSLKLAMVSTIALMSINTVTAPRIAKAYKADKHVRIRRLVIMSSQASSIFSLIILLIYIFFGEHFLNMFGENYMAAYWVLVLLSLAQLINAVTGSIGILYNMTGNEKYVLHSTAISVLVMIGCILVLGGEYGAQGGALAYAFGVCAQMTYLLLRAKKLFGFYPIAIAKT